MFGRGSKSESKPHSFLSWYFGELEELGGDSVAYRVTLTRTDQAAADKSKPSAVLYVEETKNRWARNLLLLVDAGWIRLAGGLPRRCVGEFHKALQKQTI